MAPQNRKKNTFKNQKTPKYVKGQQTCCVENTLTKCFKADIHYLLCGFLSVLQFFSLSFTLKASELMHLQSLSAFEKNIYCMISVHTLFFKSDLLELEFIK